MNRTIATGESPPGNPSREQLLTLLYDAIELAEYVESVGGRDWGKFAFNWLEKAKRILPPPHCK